MSLSLCTWQVQRTCIDYVKVQEENHYWIQVHYEWNDSSQDNTIYMTEVSIQYNTSLNTFFFQTIDEITMQIVKDMSSEEKSINLCQDQRYRL